MNKREKKKLVKTLGPVIIIAILLLFGVINKEDVLNMLNTTTQTATIVEDTGIYKVLRVVDGDTIEIDYKGAKEKVRLIGVDTPESVHPDANKNIESGKTASNYTKDLLDGKNITLEFDVQQKDKYGRLLAYVYLDGEMINKKLLAEGYAKLATYPPNVKYVEEFTKIQKEARENKKGLWEGDVF